ncbi:hypothetical protein P154DRAFT_618332 [Amniculicola lignicola CBS 123094]|uniref:Uncharacterized protein n=1 Tax=Amniculicola lignicola CBS 123094 TaxID=1392246 RepID=A0A6A5WN54_9PLEO|nr:hypothetical protein P154DRAFT_618332 [Amniculicola lignicola CBS 123094]
MVNPTHLTSIALFINFFSPTTATTPVSESTTDLANHNPPPRQFLPYTPADAEATNKKDYSLWSTCQSRFPDCTKCPTHKKCRQRPHISPPDPVPEPILEPELRLKGKRKAKGWSSTKAKRPPRNPMEGGEMNALSGAQLWWASSLNPYDGAEADTMPSNPCPLRPCSEAATEQCGVGAMCRDGFCACQWGLKALGGIIERGFTMGRGFRGKEVLTVFVDAGVRCDVRCEKFWCREVERLRGCFGGGMVEGLEEVESSEGSMGAVKAPGTGAGGAV